MIINVSPDNRPLPLSHPLVLNVVAFRIKFSRKIQRNISRKELSRLSGVAVATIKQYEKGAQTPSLTHLKWLAKALYTKPETFFQPIIIKNYVF